MSDFADPENPLPHNPFSSPGEPLRETPRMENEPSMTMLGVCLAVAAVPSFLTSYWLYFDASSSLPRKLLGVFPDLLFTYASGMGLALLVHALVHKKFATLAPGHWRLIVSLGMYGIYLHRSAPEILAAAFYAVVIWRTSESKIWKGYAWSSLIGYVWTSALMVLTPLATQQMLDDTDVGGGDPFFGSAFLIVLVMSLLKYVIDAVTLGLIVAGVINDRQNDVKRDYYHFNGLVLMLFMPLIMWAFKMAIFQMN